jgi:hypothetical protein
LFTPPFLLQSVELRERTEGGRTRPWIVVAEDEEGDRRKVVLKLRRPGPPVGDGHYGGTSLACELICSAIARLVGLRVPNYAVVSVSPSGDIDKIFRFLATRPSKLVEISNSLMRILK